jgi:hypothetical protein
VDAGTQLFMRYLTLAGVVLLLFGCWFAWPRALGTRGAIPNFFTFARTQSVVGIVLAVLGLVLAIIGLVSQPLAH